MSQLLSHKTKQSGNVAVFYNPVWEQTSDILRRATGHVGIVVKKADNVVGILANEHIVRIWLINPEVFHSGNEPIIYRRYVGFDFSKYYLENPLH